MNKCTCDWCGKAPAESMSEFMVRLAMNGSEHPIFVQLSASTNYPHRHLCEPCAVKAIKKGFREFSDANP